jgi:hypothetical protein
MFVRATQWWGRERILQISYFSFHYVIVCNWCPEVIIMGFVAYIASVVCDDLNFQMYNINHTLFKPGVRYKLCGDLVI